MIPLQFPYNSLTIPLQPLIIYEPGKQYFEAMNKKPLMSDTFGVWEGGAVEKGRRKRTQAKLYKALDQQPTAASTQTKEEKSQKMQKTQKNPWGKGGVPAFAAQKVLPTDFLVKEISNGKLKGQAGGFAERDITAGDVVCVYAGKLTFSSSIEKQAAKMLMQDTVTGWPPKRGHPLIECVLATNYEWGGLNSPDLDKLLRRHHGKDEELVIMPYPNYGNQCMAVNDGEGSENCHYTGVRYKGFPYIFLVAIQDIKTGTELLTSYGNNFFQNRDVCDFRIPGLDELTHGMSPLSDPPVQWEQQLCAKSNQIYFIDELKVAKLRQLVEASWVKDNGSTMSYSQSVYIVNKPPKIIESELKEKLRKWLDPQNTDSVHQRRKKHEAETDQVTSLLQTLGVTPQTSREQIKEAYKKLLLKYHPDKQCGHEDRDIEHAGERFAEIQKAYKSLSESWKLDIQDGKDTKRSTRAFKHA